MSKLILQSVASGIRATEACSRHALCSVQFPLHMPQLLGATSKAVMTSGGEGKRRRVVDAILAHKPDSGHTGLRERDDKHKVLTKGLFGFAGSLEDQGSCICHPSS